MISTTSLTQRVNSPAEITGAAARIRQAVLETDASPNDVMAVFESWAKALDSRDVDDIPGIVFLRMWLRRGTLEPIIARELGANALEGGWTEYGRAHCRAFPLGVVGHWPAGNIEIQPLPLDDLRSLGWECRVGQDSERSRRVDGTLNGKVGRERPGWAPYPANLHARIRAQPPRLTRSHGASRRRSNDLGRGRSCFAGSGAAFPALDEGGGLWTPDIRGRDGRSGMGQTGRAGVMVPAHARDVWQFDQQACSSPQVLFLERGNGQSTAQFLPILQRAFETENKAHPRRIIPAALTSAICQARASWLLKEPGHRAVFPKAPDWTLLLGSGSDFPNPPKERP